MKNTELFYRKAKRFQDKRNEIDTKYEKDLQALEKYKGSSGYDEEVKEIRKKYEKDLQELIKESRPDFYTVLRSMSEKIEHRSIPAPSIDMINNLKLLEMKSHLTLEECSMIAESVKDNPIAVGVVSDIAFDKKVVASLHHFDYLCPIMSNNAASDIVKGLQRDIEDFLQFNTTKASRLASDYQFNHYGNTGSNATKRNLFSSQSEFYDSVGLSGDTFSKFSAIVDHEQNDIE